MAKQAVLEAQKEARLAAIEAKLNLILALLENKPAEAETVKAKPAKAEKPAEK